MELRASNMARMTGRDSDVVVLGGGINGAVSAASLSARGARVVLLDRGDFAGFTSQHSSNLAWGGIKYLETFEFGLVRKLCLSRNHLMRSYPSTVQEIRFLTVHEKGFRHGLWKLLAGTWLYWLMGNGFTRVPRLLSRAGIARDEPVVALGRSDGGFEYSDAYLHDNDARFVWNFVRGAMDHGCLAANYVESLGAKREAGAWTVRARDVLTGREWDLRTRVLINACGPFVDEHNGRSGVTTEHHHAFSKGIHLIVPRITDSPRVLTFFADDGRLFFVIPMGVRTCIGTTDTRVTDPVTRVEPEDRAFVLENINKRLQLRTPLTEEDIIAERCGVRPLVIRGNAKAGRDWLQMSRKHVMEVDRDRAAVSIFGGKLTDCINVGDEAAAAAEQLGVTLPFPRARWYGEPGEDVRKDFFHEARLMDLDGMTSPSSNEMLTTRLWRRYGRDAFQILDAVRRDRRMGDLLIENAEYIRGEIELARRREMVTLLEDFLRRRSKIELVVKKELLRGAPGLKEACRIFFEDQAELRMAEYFGDPLPAALPSPAPTAPVMF